MQKTLLVISGPTAIGKTDLAIQLAQYYQTEIISTDARQFYREISIGTAKPTEQELAMVPHHFIGNKSIFDSYSAGDFEREALLCLNQLFQNKDLVIAIGGSGLYIKALCEGFDEMPKVDEQLRLELIQLFEKEGLVALQNILQEVDPVKFNTIDQQNPQRLMRAIEIAKQGNQEFKNEKKVRPFRILKIGLKMERELLYQRINKRVEMMMHDGLLEEAKSVYPHRNLNALKTVGYNELFSFLSGEIEFNKATELIQQHTRNYAKRQLTWFQKEIDINWFNPQQLAEIKAWIDNQL